MQPMLVICASQPGILYLNGHFSGETAPDEPVIRPIAPRGAVYMDYRPMKNGCMPVTRKIVFSGGRPLQESVESAEDIGAIIWPGGICEIEITPPDIASPDSRKFSFGSHTFYIRGDIPKLYCGERLLGTLPEGASIPRIQKMQGGFVFIGEAVGGMYLLSADLNLKGSTGFLSADKIEICDAGNITALLAENDFAGHATTEKWQLTADGLELISSEPGWTDGSARQPASALETALAAVQAALLGKKDEAAAYLTEKLMESDPFSGIFGKYDLCTEMKYALPYNRPCIALLRMDGEHMAMAEPLYYSCVQLNGRYLIDQMNF